MSIRKAALAGLMVTFAACSHAPPRTGAVTQQGSSVDPGTGISPFELRRDLFIFADDSFHGRETGSVDAQRAAAFLARRVQQLGLEPAGDSLYMQRIPLVRETYARTTELTVTSLNGQRQTLRIGTDVAPVLSLGNALPAPRRMVDGDILFAGYGPLDEPSATALLPLAPEGKVIVALHGAPPKTRAGDIARLNSMQTLGERIRNLMALHPSAVVILMTGDAEALYDQMTPELLRGVALDGLTSAPAADSGAQTPMLLVGIARRGSPILPARWPNDLTPQPLGEQLTARINVDRVPFTGYNVAAVVRGYDPRLNMTYLAYGAHYDHIGIIHGEARRGRRGPVDSIANGADDDGSGSVALLAIARQMMIYRPRRSVLFVWHVGEEKGMLGSAFFTDHSTVPIDSIVTQFNADMIGRNENSLALVGPRAAPNYLSWRLGMIVDSVNMALEKPLHIERKWDDPEDPDQMYQRSDHYNYARKGIPVIFFTTGMHEDYHRVSDEASKIDYDKLARVSRLMLESGLAVANRSSRPTSEAITQSISSRP